MGTTNTMPHVVTDAECRRRPESLLWGNSYRLCRLREEKNFRWS